VHAINSPQYLEVVEAQSTGSTKVSGNRFNKPLFNAFKVRFPAQPEDLASIVTVMARANALRADLAKLLDLAKDVRDGVSLMLPGPD
jgi:hypothetical protein